MLPLSKKQKCYLKSYSLSLSKMLPQSYSLSLSLKNVTSKLLSLSLSKMLPQSYSLSFKNVTSKLPHLKLNNSCIENSPGNN